MASVYALLTAGVELVVLTEVLGKLSILTPTIVAVAWGISTLATGAWAVSSGRLGYLREIAGVSLRGPLLEQAILVGIGLIIAASLVVAVITPPNNWDSLTYHMSRVCQWASHRSVDHYPTNIARQLYQGPFAEFVILHLYLLTGSDVLANAVQCGAWAGAVIVASLLAKDLGASKRGQVWSALLVATAPMAVLQATNTQNDLVLGFMMLAMALFMLRVIRAPAASIPWKDFAFAGAAMGLAVLTKGNAYSFVTPWLVVFVAVAMYRWRGGSLAPLTACAVVAIAVNGGHWSRNYQTFGSPFGVTVEYGTFRANIFTNDAHTPGVLVSNVLRNVSQHMVFCDRTYSTAGPVMRGVSWIHERLGIDVNDPRTTWAGEKYVLDDAGWNNLDQAGNPLHLIIAVVCGLVAMGKPRWTSAVFVTLLTLSSFLLFCLLMRWQPWHSRLHLPLFFMLAPGSALVLQRLRWPVAAWTISVILLIGAGWRVVSNRYHPWQGDWCIFTVPRIDQYGVANGALLEPLHQISERLQRAGVDSIQLASNNDEPEYLLWVFAHLRCVQHVDVKNVTSKLPSKTCDAPVRVELKFDQGVLRLSPIADDAHR